MEIQLTRHEPDTDSGPEKIVDPPGEKFVFVLGGNIEFTVGEDIFELEEGDSLYYPGDFPVSYRVTKGKPCRCIFIVTPPSF
jgi:quercetin dioxygenase-like cupin family protein